MKITQENVQSLLDALRGTTPPAPREERRRYHVGAVWFGDWFTKADKGRFGSTKSPKHFAAVLQRNPKKTRFTLKPITSKTNKDAVVLPPGLLPGATKFTVSYLLFRITLQATRRTLDTHFEYRCTLPNEYISKAKETCHHDGNRR